MLSSFLDITRIDTLVIIKNCTPGSNRKITESITQKKRGKFLMILRDKVTNLTGSRSGIGRATALQLAAEGANVIVNYSQSE